VRTKIQRKEVNTMFMQTLLIGTGTLVAITAVIWSVMPVRRVDQSFVL